MPSPSLSRSRESITPSPSVSRVRVAVHFLNIGDAIVVIVDVVDVGDTPSPSVSSKPPNPGWSASQWCRGCHQGCRSQRYRQASSISPSPSTIGSAGPCGQACFHAVRGWCRHRYRVHDSPVMACCQSQGQLVESGPELGPGAVTIESGWGRLGLGCHPYPTSGPWVNDAIIVGIDRTGWVEACFVEVGDAIVVSYRGHGSPSPHPSSVSGGSKGVPLLSGSRASGTPSPSVSGASPCYLLVHRHRCRCPMASITSFNPSLSLSRSWKSSTPSPSVSTGV